MSSPRGYVPSLSAVRSPARACAAPSRTRDAGPQAESVYLTGRNIGDEYRYIIDRKYATKFPGNMLERPSLLLNPWAVRDRRKRASNVAAEGDDFGAPSANAASAAERQSCRERRPAPAARADFANLDFLVASRRPCW